MIMASEPAQSCLINLSEIWSGERTFGVLTKLDLMDKGTNALDVCLICQHAHWLFFVQTCLIIDIYSRASFDI